MKYENEEYVVSGLIELEEIDLFQSLEVQFNGYSPYVSVALQLVDTDEIYTKLQYKPVSEGYWEEGDEVVFEVSHIDGLDVDSYLAQYGYCAKEKEKCYIVSDVGRYVTEVTEIPQDIMDEINQEAIDAIKAYCAGKFNVDTRYTPTYVGNYFLTLKKGVEASEKNHLIMIYKMNVALADLWREKWYKKDYTYYMAVNFSNITIDSIGEIKVDLRNYYLCNAEVKLKNDFVETYNVKGYTSLQNCEAGYVNPNMANYVYSINYLEEQ